MDKAEPRRTADNSRGRRRVSLLVKTVVVLGLLWAAFELLGLRVVQVSRSVPLVQAEIAPSQYPNVGTPPRNVILFVADGLGFAHLSAARAALHGINGQAVWDRFPVTGWQRTHPAIGFLTDSAAAASALATGEPIGYGAIGVDADGRPLKTLFERASELGYRTGVVTDSYVWDATPAAFVTHSPARENENAESALRQLGDSSLDFLVGELEDVGEKTVPEWAESIELLSNRFEVLGPESEAEMLRALATGASPVAAVFEEDQITDLDSSPNLPDLVTAVLAPMASGDQPFLLLVESEEPDSASHSSDFARLLRGMQAIETTLEILLDFATTDGETLLVFTSDHETGGLALSIAGRHNWELEAIWPTRDHTGVAVPVLAFGPGAEAFGGIRANWETGKLLRGMLPDVK
jgi:alkaline phosphatase